MEEMRIYIANLGKYNEGELVGAWFTPPVDFEEVKERIGLNDEYEEYAIHDYELPFMSMWMGSICAATGVESLKMWPSWWQSRSMRNASAIHPGRHASPRLKVISYSLQISRISSKCS